MILVRSLIEWNRSDQEQRVFRVLAIDGATDSLWLFLIGGDSLPIFEKLSEVDAAVENLQARILDIDPYAHLQEAESFIPEKYRIRRDAAWKVIEPIVNSPGIQAFDPKSRGRLVDEAVKKHSVTKKYIYKSLRKYWERGMIPNALLPEYPNCGARGQERIPGNQKRGRPRALAKLNGEPLGVNVDGSIRERLQRGFKLFCQKRPEEGGQGIGQGFESTLRKFFYIGFERKNGRLHPILPDLHVRPTLGQFKYWGPKGCDRRESIIRTRGERDYNLRYRPVLGDSTLMSHGPGAIYQLDSTPADVWLVSGLDPSRRLGKAIVYSVVDQFSHMIVGIYVGLENSSFHVAGLALENAIVNKVPFCAEHGCEIISDEWPVEGLPESLIADRGELEGYGASEIVKSLGVSVSNTAPYRADLKGIVERSFRSMNDAIIHRLPGATRKARNRGERHPGLSAALTVKEFRTLLIYYVLQHNSRRIEGYRLQRDMIAAGLEPRPIDIWRWGIRHRSGNLRKADLIAVKRNLLPGGKATVTFRGIRFRGLYYSCERAVRERWYERARTEKSWQIEITFDPRCVDAIFARIVGISQLELCHIVEADHRFIGVSWTDVDDFHASQKEMRDRTSTKDLQAKSNLTTIFDDVVEHAVERAAVANKGLNKSEQLRNVRHNRVAELKIQNDAHNAEVPNLNGNNIFNRDSNNDGTAESPSEIYVPPPSNTDLFRQQRENQTEKI